MGLSVDWIAVEGASQDALLSQLGLEVVGEVGSEFSHAYASATTASGWVIVLFGRAAHEDLDKILPALPPDLLSLGGEMSETVMFSRARAWRGGRQIWAVTHNCEATPSDILEGRLPLETAEIQRVLNAEQAAEDEAVDHLFDLPLEVARAFTGYRPGEGDRLDWKALRRIRPNALPAPGATRSLFGVIKSEVVPAALAAGWRLKSEASDIREPGSLTRRVGDIEQTIWFDYADIREPYIEVHFWAEDSNAPDTGFLAVGSVAAASPPPLWRRIPGLAKSPPPRDVSLAGLVAQAREDIGAIDRYLTTGGSNLSIALTWRRALEPWPVSKA